VRAPQLRLPEGPARVGGGRPVDNAAGPRRRWWWGGWWILIKVLAGFFFFLPLSMLVAAKGVR